MIELRPVIRYRITFIFPSLFPCTRSSLCSSWASAMFASESPSASNIVYINVAGWEFSTGEMPWQCLAHLGCWYDFPAIKVMRELLRGSQQTSEPRHFWFFVRCYLSIYRCYVTQHAAATAYREAAVTCHSQHAVRDRLPLCRLSYVSDAERKRRDLR